ncbi:MAG TPA: hypothetical protein VKA70_02280 [Blastocatellia bacterium]|nr:hypothetical protein [Blastocatellia bacterium]
MSTSQQPLCFKARFRMGVCLRPLLILAIMFIGSGVGLGQDQRPSPPAPEGIIDVAGYFTAYDNWQHAIVCNGGKFYEIFFDPNRGLFQASLGRFPDIVAIAAEFAPADARRQNIIAVSRTGSIYYIHFIPGFPVYFNAIEKIKGVVDVAAFYSDDTEIQRAVLATSSGDIIELEWRSGCGLDPCRVFRKTTLTNIPGARHVAGFFTRDDRYNIVLVSTSGGDVYEIYYKTPDRIGKSIIASYSNIIDVAGFYTDDDQLRHAIIGTGDGTIHEVFYNPRVGKASTPLLTVPGLTHVAGYATTDAPGNHWRHVIASTSAGEVKEVYYDPAKGVWITTLRSYSPEFAQGVTPSEKTAIEVTRAGPRRH